MYLKSTGDQPEGGEDIRMVWIGDFNRHSPMWDDPKNNQIFTSGANKKAVRLLAMVAKWVMVMALPAGLPTLEHSSSKTWTRLDNIWVDNTLLNGVTRCIVEPGQRPIKMDHLPMSLELDLTPSRIDVEERYDWRATTWKDFSKEMEAGIQHLPVGPIKDIPDLESRIKELDNLMIHVRNEHVPKVKPSIYTK